MDLVLLFTCLSIFIDYTLQEGELLGEYYKWITKELYDSGITWKRKLFSILGGCVFCMNPYLTTIGYVFFTDVFSLQMLLTIISVNHVMLRLWYKFLN